jgi:hypothetical protein
MEDIDWNGSYSGCAILAVTLSVGIGNRLLYGNRISHLIMYVTVPLPAQYSTHCTGAQDVSLNLYHACYGTFLV